MRNVLLLCFSCISTSVLAGSLNSDIDVAIAIVESDGWHLAHLSDEMKKNKKVVIAAINSNPFVLKIVDADLKKDKDIIMAAVKKNGAVLWLVPRDFRKDREIILTAVSNYGDALAFAPNNFRKDEEVVLTAMKNRVASLEYADESLKNNRVFMLKAIKESEGNALGWASMDLRNDKELVLESLKNDTFGHKFDYVGKKLDKDADVLRTACNALSDYAKQRASNKKLLSYCTKK